MKRIPRLAVAVTLLTLLISLPMARPAHAGCIIVSEGAGADWVAANYNVQTGHTYTFSVTGAVNDSGSFTWTDPPSVTSLSIPPNSYGTVSDDSADCGGANNWFRPSDGRVDPRPADRLVIFCNNRVQPPTLDVWGVMPDKRGVRLYLFNIADLVAAGRRGLTQDLGNQGVLAVGYYAPSQFGISWLGGPFNANGAADFRKTVTCSFDRAALTAPLNSNQNLISGQPTIQPTPSGTVGNCTLSVVVQPNDTLFRIAKNNNTTVAVLAQLNGIGDPNRILVGQTICLPRT